MSPLRKILGIRYHTLTPNVPKTKHQGFPSSNFTVARWIHYCASDSGQKRRWISGDILPGSKLEQRYCRDTVDRIETHPHSFASAVQPQKGLHPVNVIVHTRMYPQWSSHGLARSNDPAALCDLCTYSSQPYGKLKSYACYTLSAVSQPNRVVAVRRLPHATQTDLAVKRIHVPCLNLNDPGILQL